MFTITPISLLPSSQGRSGWFLPHLYFPKFHKSLQFSGPKEEHLTACTRFWRAADEHIQYHHRVLELLFIPHWPFSYLHALLLRMAHILLHLEHGAHGEGCFCNCLERSSLPQWRLFHFVAGGVGLGPVRQNKTSWNTRLSYRLSRFCYFWT